MQLKERQLAPNFVLPDQNGKRYSLSEYRGNWVLIYFYPKDDTPGCTKEACLIRDNFPKFKKLKAKVFGISVDSIKSHAKFTKKYKLPFTILADEDKKVVKKYGVWSKKKFMGKEYMGTLRTSFLIDQSGKIAKIYEKINPEVHVEEVLSDLNKKVIGFDMDGVILDPTQNKISSAKKLGVSITKKQTPSEIIRTIIPQKAYEKFKNYLYDDTTSLLRQRLMPGVKNVLNYVLKNHVPYFLISKQINHPMAVKILKHHGLWPKYFNKKNAFFVDGIEAKNTKAVQLGITHYFDDETQVLEKLVDVKNKFLFDHLDAFKNSGYARVKSWKEIAKLI